MDDNGRGNGSVNWISSVTENIRTRTYNGEIDGHYKKEFRS
jgi:hypothetical protein